METTEKFTASANVVAREVGGEMVLLDLGSGTYFGLNEVGGEIWQLIEGKSLKLAEICEKVLEKYDVERDRVEADVEALVSELVERGLLEKAS